MRLQNILQNILEKWPQARTTQFGKANEQYRMFKALFDVDFKNYIENIVNSDNSLKKYDVNSSIGQGGWADVPWLSILDTDITETTQSGIYPVYLFKSDGSGVYLGLAQGSQKLREQYKPKQNYINEAGRRSQFILDRFPELKEWGDSKISLEATSDTGKSYEYTTIIAKFYPVNAILGDKILVEDLKYLLNKYQEMKSVILKLYTTKETEALLKSKKINFAYLPKPFLILAGISGSGKTRFIREQAKRWSETLDNYCLIPVRPDWHEPSDLLGYISRLSGNAEYVVTDLLKFIVKAWRVIAQELTFEGNAVKGSEETLGRINPFWLCLDEMNLAPVEQYFADYLSILETREWEWEGNEFKYRSDGLLSVDLFNQFKKNSNFLRDLGFKENKDENNENDKILLEFFEQNGIPLPFNLIVAGTVNMDETTHGFSRKVLDRALSFDFSEFYPNNFEQFFEPQVQAITLTYPHHSTATKLKTNLDSLFQEYNVTQESLNFLNKINEIFKNTPFKLAYRALNELLLNVWSFQPNSQAELQAVWDDFLMLKVLPRLEGDQDKLAFDDEYSLFDKLEEILKNQLSEIWAEDKWRVDFFNQDLEGNKLNNLSCRSRQKLEQMKKQLERQHFTSFWQ
ncbi:MrcB family domain-containing protein [Pasteurella sp. PK-2025]|uniref:MrcB family domain-containing protein n=1 Tax=Pasteurella sp. PK-2025 TaxID=3413133 RepID=UPI003C755071